jgi:hypothetical protein
MSRTKKIAVLAIIAMVLTLMPAALFAATADSTRLSGAGRVETALDIASASTWGTSVVLAAADNANLVDALAAAPLASQENAPILLTFKGSLDAAVKAKIAALGATKVYIVGAISADVAAQVDAMTGVDTVVLKGATRQATADLVNAKLTSPAGTFVVGFDAVPDALSIASYAAKNKFAIMLTNADGTFSGTALGTTKYIVGGTAKVKDITGFTRISGADRFATNNAVASTLTFSYDRVYVANGVSCVDALSVAPLAAKYSAFVALSSASEVAAATTVNAKLTSTSKVIAVGGTAAVSDAVAAKVNYASNALTVQSVTAVNLNQVKVVFSGAVDKASAEAEGNYLVSGAALVPATDAAVLQEDGKTVLVTMNAPQLQYAKAWFTVSKAVLSKDLLQTAPKVEQELTFTDTTVPTVVSATVSGNSQVTVKFSEPIKLVVGDAVGFKINDQAVANYGFTAPATVQNPTAANYADTIVLNFGASLPIGTNTLTVQAGTSTTLVDAAGFMVARTAVSFTVDSITSAPTVTTVTGSNNGTVYVTYSRAMKDSSVAADGALTLANYDIGDGATIPTAASFEPGSGNKVVKLTFAAGKVVLGANVLVIDKGIVDTYGNAMSLTADTRLSYTATSDTVKPTVASVTLTTNTNVRVKFSETVNFTYGQNLANYKLKDAAGTDISARMTGVVAVPTAGVNSDTFDITIAPALGGSNYTLTIKNIVDTAYTPNTMTEYTATISGSDTTGPAFSVAVAAPILYKVVAYFDEPMDAATITTLANYAYTGGDGITRALPAGTTLTTGDGNKLVEIAFPTSYTTAAGATSSNIAAIRIANVKDAAGNVLALVATTNAVVANTAAGAVAVAPTLVANSFKLAPSGANIVAEIEFNRALSTLVLADFTIAGVTADSGYLSGNKVVLTFTGGKVATIKALGTTNTVTAAAPASADLAGIKAAAIGATTVYGCTLAPKVSTITASQAGNSVVVTFDTPIDAGIAGLYMNDFTITNNSQGKVINATGVTAAGSAITYTFAAGNILTGNSLTVTANSANIDVKSVADKNLVQTLFVPAAADISGNTFNSL